MSRTNHTTGKTHHRLRRGLALVMVLGILAVVMGLSYALLRKQSSGVQLASNSDRAATARDAAFAGMSVALDRMHQSGWAGVDTPLSGTLSSSSTYTVTFATGDASLTPASANYHEYPFRVTVTSVGLSVDPANPQTQSQFTITAVVQLARRAIQTQPSAWTNMQPHTVYQWSTNDAFVQFPCRIEGSACFQGRLQLCSWAPSSVTPRARYLGDLEEMREVNLGDRRPFNQDLTWTGWRQTSETVGLITSQLGLDVVENSLSSGMSLSRPGAISSYRLYPGGRQYSIVNVNTAYGSTLSNVTLAAHPLTNPLGVFYSSGSVTIGNNVTLDGTLVAGTSSASYSVSGTGVQLRGRNLPALDGSTAVRQLPVLIAGDDIRFSSGSSASIQGAAMVWDMFEVLQGVASTQLDLRGKLLSGRLSIRARDEWLLSTLIWEAEHLLFTAQEDEEGGTPYFPQWMQIRRGFNPQPLLTLRPNSSGVSYHWIDWSQPVFTPAPGDSGLRWNLLSWAESG